MSLPVFNHFQTKQASCEKMGKMMCIMQTFLKYEAVFLYFFNLQENHVKDFKKYKNNYNTVSVTHTKLKFGVGVESHPDLILEVLTHCTESLFKIPLTTPNRFLKLSESSHWMYMYNSSGFCIDPIQNGALSNKHLQTQKWSY